MNKIVRDIRSTYRDHTPNKEANRLYYHVGSSIVFAVAITILIYSFDHINNVLINIDVFVGFIRTMFALLFTILAIILTFEGQYSENRAIKELQRTGHYREIFRRFYLSVFILGVLLILISTITIFGLYNIEMSTQVPYVGIEINPVGIGTVFLISAGFVLTVFRVSTCFIIYYRIEKIIKNYRNE